MPYESTSGAPQGISLETFAELSAEIAAGARPLPELLAARGLSLDAWHEVTAHFTRLLAFDESGDLVEQYAHAFTAAQDRSTPSPEMTVEAWAELSSSVARRGIGALREHGMSEMTYLKLGRSWAKRLANDRPLAHRYHQAFFAAAAKEDRSV